MEKPELRFLNVSEVKISSRARDELGDMKEMVESVRAKGVLQPITVDQDMRLLAGFRRLTAAKEAGLIEIPALIHPLDTVLGEDIDAKECELIENIHRLDMTWQEKAKLTSEIQDLYIKKYGHSYRTDKGGWSAVKTARLIGVSDMEVNRSLKMAEAMKAMPELAKCKTEKEAFDRLKRMEEAIIIKIMKEKQAEDAPSVSNLERFAASHYRIGDALTAMEDLTESGWVGATMIEVDPPYGIELTEVKRMHGEFNPNIDGYTEIPSDKYPAFLDRISQLTYKCAASSAWMLFWFGPTWHGAVLDALKSAGWKVDDIPGIWCKGTGQTNAPEIYLARTYEPFFICRKGQPVLRERGKPNVLHYRPVPADQKYHATERPLDLMTDLVGTFSYPGSIILVPFLGSGVTLRAAYRHNVTGFGWDLSEDVRDRFLLRVREDAEKLESKQ